MLRYAAQKSICRSRLASWNGPGRLYTTVRPVIPRRHSRLKQYVKSAAYLVIGLGAIWEVDKEYNASAIARNLRTLWTVGIHRFSVS